MGRSIPGDDAVSLMVELAREASRASTAFVGWLSPRDIPHEPRLESCGVGPLFDPVDLARSHDFLRTLLNGDVNELEFSGVTIAAQGKAESAAFAYAVRLPEQIAGKDGILCLLNETRLKFGASQRRLIGTIAKHCGYLRNHSPAAGGSEAQVIEVVDRLPPTARTIGGARADILHDLRGPLSAIVAFADLMKTQKEMCARAEHSDDYIDLIRISGQLALDLTEDLLTLDQSTIGGAGRLEAVDLRKLTETCIAVVRPDCERRQIRVLNGATGRTYWKSTASRALQRIVLNLVKNAVAHNPPGTTIRIQSDVIVDQLTVAVIDNGPGPQGVASDRPRREREATEGFGLGLQIVHALAAQLGGRFEFDSQPGLGTAATVHIPAFGGHS